MLIEGWVVAAIWCVAMVVGFVIVVVVIIIIRGVVDCCIDGKLAAVRSDAFTRAGACERARPL